MMLFLNARGSKFTSGAHLLFTAILKLQVGNGLSFTSAQSNLMFDPISLVTGWMQANGWIME